jgi:hypothetical protein
MGRKEKLGIRRFIWSVEGNDDGYSIITDAGSEPISLGLTFGGLGEATSVFTTHVWDEIYNCMMNFDHRNT